MYFSLFNVDRGRAVAATAIPLDSATGGEAEVCGNVNSYDFAEPMFGGHQQNSSLTAADVNEGRSWDHFLAAPLSFRKTRSSVVCTIARRPVKPRRRSVTPATIHTPRPKFDHRKQK
jgi:hypothetical protein